MRVGERVRGRYGEVREVTRHHEMMAYRPHITITDTIRNSRGREVSILRARGANGESPKRSTRKTQK